MDSNPIAPERDSHQLQVVDRKTIIRGELQIKKNLPANGIIHRQVTNNHETRVYQEDGRCHLRSVITTPGQTRYTLYCKAGAVGPRPAIRQNLC